jgi:hypothetical protein
MFTFILECTQRPMTVAMPNLSLVETKWITVREVDSWENTGDLATPSSLCNTRISCMSVMP